MSLSRTLQYAFIAIVTISVGFSLYQWNASRASSTVKLNSSPTASLTSGLVGYWTFDGKDTPWSSSSAGTATDRSGNSNTGTLTNMNRSTSPAEGKLGQALSFNGSNTWVNLGDAASLHPSTITLAAWVKTTVNSANYNMIIDRQKTSWVSYVLFVKNGKVVTEMGYTDSPPYTGSLTSNRSVNDGQWHLVVGTYDGSAIRIYVDGVLDNSTAFSQTLLYTGASPIHTVRIGQHNDESNSYFNGSIDEVRIYNRALSAGEVQSLYDLGASDKVNSSVSQNQGTGRLDSGLAGYWKLDDGSGTTATDSSVNGNNGTLTNGPTWGTGRIGGDAVFDGTDDYVTVVDNATTSITGAITVSTWIKNDLASGTANKGLVAKWIGLSGGSPVNQRSYNLGLDFQTDNNNPKAAFGISQDGTGASSANATGITTINASSWYHIVGVFVPNVSVAIYVNGVKEGEDTSSVPSSIYDSTSALNIGNQYCISNCLSASYYFDGSIDEVRVYNRALSDDEVSQLYRLTAPTGVDTSLKGYWSFNGKDTNWTSSSAGTVADLSGNGNTGTMTNMSRATSPAEGKLGQALNFDGTDDFVQASNASSLQFANATPITLSAWVKPSQVAAYATFLIKGRDTNDSEGNYAFRQSSTGKLEFYYNESGNTNWHVWTTTSAVFSTANQWYHVAVTYTFGTGSSIRAYINGESVAGSWSSGTGNVAPDISTQKLMIGQKTTGERFAGLIDEVRIYNRALIASEIASLYNNGKVVLNSTKKIYITTPGAGTFSAPADWPGVADKVEVIGGGAAGGKGYYWNYPGAGGGGGAYARKSNVAISNGASLQVGSGGSGGNGAGGGDTWIVSSGTVKAAGAAAHAQTVVGAGGAAGSSIGDLVYSGGNGGSVPLINNIGGAGGGGAAGPRGAGKNGGNSARGGCCEISGGGGGGGAGGGSSTAGSNSGTGDSAGAPGGTAQDGTAGGTANNNGSHGSGAGGGWNATIGGNGGSGVEFDSTHGAGGGGGGGGGGGSSYNGGGGGEGGTYGGGGGGGGQDGTITPDYTDGGNGGQGIIVITYTPS